MIKNNFMFVKEFYKSKIPLPNIKHLIELKNNWKFVFFDSVIIKNHIKPVQITSNALFLFINQFVCIEFFNEEKLILNRVNSYFGFDLIEKVIPIPSIEFYLNFKE
jgi:hypothetical protein